MTFQKAVREQRPLRAILTGPTHAGKSYTALLIAQGMGGQWAMLDTERRRGLAYADRFPGWTYEYAELTPPFNPDRYIALMKEAADAGLNLIVDSVTHAWNADGGILSLKDASTFTGWKVVTPIQERFVKMLLDYPGHIIATAREKMDYFAEETENANGRKSYNVKAVGLAPQQRDGFTWEWDEWYSGNTEHVFTVRKSMVPAISDMSVLIRPGVDLGRTLAEWCAGGDPAPLRQPRPAQPAPRPIETVRPQPTQPAPVKAAPPVQVAARDDVTDGDAFPDDIEAPADLPKGVTDFLQVVDTHRMQLGRATYGQAAVLYGVLRSHDAQFNWGYLKDDGQRAAAYRTAMTHVRKSEAQAA